MRKRQGEENLAERLEQALWSVSELAAFLGVPVATIYAWRTRGEGPPGLRIGRHLRFAASDVARWLASLQTCRNTALA